MHLHVRAAFGRIRRPGTAGHEIIETPEDEKFISITIVTVQGTIRGLAKFKLGERVRRIGQQEVRTVEEIRENPAAGTMYWIQLESDFATRMWAKESELELVPKENRVMARPVDPRDKH